MDDTSEVPAGIPVLSVAGSAGSLDLTVAEERLVLFVLSPECPYCKQNMRWWRDITEALSEAGTSRIRVLSTGTTREASEFLGAHRLEAPVWTIDKAALDLLGLPALPATVLVDPRAGVAHRWIGVIDNRLGDDLVEWLRGGSIPPSWLKGAHPAHRPRSTVGGLASAASSAPPTNGSVSPPAPTA